MWKFSLAGFIIIFTLIVGSIIGEVMCICKCVVSDWKAPYYHEAIYGLSALTGFGFVVGWINIPDGTTTK